MTNDEFIRKTLLRAIQRIEAQKGGSYAANTNAAERCLVLAVDKFGQSERAVDAAVALYVRGLLPVVGGKIDWDDILK